MGHAGTFIDVGHAGTFIDVLRGGLCETCDVLSD